MLSGIVRTHRRPLTAQTNARAMPVLPLVGSTIVVLGPIRPSRWAAEIIAIPMRSLTLESGLKNSNFAYTFAFDRIRR
jgi:hypothetical protein